VFLNATRALNHRNHIGLKFLIGTVEDFVQSKLMMDMKGNALPQSEVEWLAFQELCKHSGIGLFHTAQRVQGSDNNLDGNKLDMGQFLFSDKQNDKCDPQTSLKLVEHLNDKYCLYVPFKNDSKMHITPLLLKIFEIVNIEPVIQFLGKKGRQDNVLNNFKLFKNKMTAKSIADEKEVSIIHKFPTLLNWVEFENITKFDKSLNSQHSVSFLWFKSNKFDDKDEMDSYLPTIVLNTTTNELNFLVWYSDADEEGFMRHAAIQENDVLSSRLTRHAKMLVYCEDPKRQEKYSKMLSQVLNKFASVKISMVRHDKYASLTNNLISLIPKKSRQFISTVIPRINEYYYREIVISGSSGIRSAFDNLENLEACVRSIFGLN